MEQKIKNDSLIKNATKMLSQKTKTLNIYDLFLIKGGGAKLRSKQCSSKSLTCVIATLGYFYWFWF